MTMQQAARAAMGLIVAAVVAACGEVKPDLTPEQIVAERSQARVDAMTSGDYASAYQYYTPGYRSSTGEADFVVRFKVSKVKWTDGRLVDVQCEQSLCNARVDIDYFVDEPMRGVSEHRSTRRIDETWINVGDQWYYVDES